MKFKKFISLILVISILMNFFPVTVFAQYIETPYVETNSSEQAVEQENTSSIIGEIEEERTLNSKSYYMSDGSISVATYPTNIHYKENGKYKDINNNLKWGLNDYKISDNKIDYKFSKKGNDKKLITIKSNDYTIKWGLNNASKVKGDVTNFTSTGKNDIYDVFNTSSSIIYKNILSNIDIRYDIYGTNVKGTIVVNKKTDLTNKLVFNLESKDLVISRIDEQTLVLKNIKDEEIYFIEAPMMYDSALEYSALLKLDYEAVKNGYKIILTVDNEWINSDKRVYPISIDPSIVSDRDYNTIEDTMIYAEDSRNTSKGYAHVIRVGSNPFGDGMPFRSLVKFTLPTLKAGDQVIDAKFYLHNYQETSLMAPTSEVMFDIHQVTSDWNEASAYWSNMNDKYISTIVDHFKYKYDNNDPNKANVVNITSVVKDWYNNGNNYGLMIKEHNEIVGLNRRDVPFLSSDTNKAAYYWARPVAVITYRNQNGLEGYQTFQNYEMGRSGSVYTNDYNGNLVYVHNDLGTTGSRLPASIYHVFNTNDKDNNIGYGLGYKLNLYQTMEEVTISNIGYVRFTDEDGTEHYFRYEAPNFIDEDGLGFTLTKPNNTFLLKDKKGNQSLFTKLSDNKWHLTKITDTFNNNITINYNGLLISNVVDATGEVLTLNYTNNLLSSIVNANNDYINYNYTNSLLTSITYKDSKTTTINYSNNLITKVSSIDNSGYSFEYYNAGPNRIKKVSEISTDSIIGNYINISYKNNSTKFVSNDLYTTNLSFNDFGNTINTSSYGKTLNL